MPRDENSTAPDPAPAGTAPTEAAEAALDGVRYARLFQKGACWRLGSLSPLWREEAAGLAPEPDAAALEELAGRGVWLAPDAPCLPLAVMCCGLGSVWPGMGRELYDNFPAAREAMDQVAALADWDVLGLMDESDVEAISHTRRQIPYLFLLEYAQWRQFVSLGIAPALFCGHSLGELIALSFSGIYGLKEAWCILDTRAEHMAELETQAARDTGMMAVHTEASVIDEILASWPELYVSNRNTPRQFILSGPRQSLAEARAALRKRRVPAMLLNVSLAFHHPGMRILRDLSQRRLLSLEMHAPVVPMLSGITAGFYPHDQPSICRHMTDLDENTVAWTECVEAMWRRDGIRHFLELGPQDTLCSLAVECEPRALCLSAGRKGNEVKAMREACARLYALGHLSWPLIARRGAERGVECPAAASQSQLASSPSPAKPAEIFSGPDADKSRLVLELLAQASGRPASSIRPEHDLRYDLALRSSRFPLLLQEAEARLCVHVEFEALLQAATVGDLVGILLGRVQPGVNSQAQARASAAPLRRPQVFSPPLLRFSPPVAADASAQAPQEPLDILPLDPAGSGPGVVAGGVYALCVLDAAILPGLWSGLASFGAAIAVPKGQMADCAALAEAGSSLLALDVDAHSGPEALAQALDSLLASCGRLDGILLAPPAERFSQNQAQPQTLLGQACAAWLGRQPQIRPWFACLGRWRCTPEEAAGILEGQSAEALAAWMQSMTEVGAKPALALLDDERPLGREILGETLGDALALELFRGNRASALLSLPESSPRAIPASLLDRPEIFAPVYPEPWAGYGPALAPESGLFQGGFQFSRFAEPALGRHGAWGLSADAPSWLPFSRALLALLQGARLLFPWLTVTGFTDVRFFDSPLLKTGIVREGRVTARARPWIMLDGSLTRMCRTALSLRELTANGRHKDSFAPLAEAMTLLAAGPRQAPPLALFEPEPSGEAASGQELPLAQLYDRLRLGPDWRLIARLAPLRRKAADEVLGVHRGELESAIPEAKGPSQESIAELADWGYAQALRWTAAVMESALLVLEHEAAASDSGRPSGHCPDAADAVAPPCLWQCRGLGFIRFGVADFQPGGENARPALELRRTWNDGRRARFDAQVSGACGEALLTAHHMEFARQDKTD